MNECEMDVPLDDVMHPGLLCLPDLTEDRGRFLMISLLQGPGAARPATMAEVEELLKEGKRLGLQLKGLPKLISMMAQARSFSMRARRALKKGTFPGLMAPLYLFCVLGMTFRACMPCRDLWPFCHAALPGSPLSGIDSPSYHPTAHRAHQGHSECC